MTRSRAFGAAAVEVGLAFAGLLLGYVVVTLLAVLLRGAIGDLAESAAVGLVAGPLITVVAAIVYGYAGRTWDAGGEPGSVATAKRTLPYTLVVVLLASIAAILGSIAIAIGLDLVGLPVQEQKAVTRIAEDLRAGEGMRDAILLSISALLVGPAAEEVLFRVLLFRRIARGSGVLLAYVFSGLAFAAIHGNPAGFVVYAWLGTCFAATLHRTGRPGAAIAVHMVNNAFVLANLFFAGA